MGGTKPAQDAPYRVGRHERISRLNGTRTTLLDILPDFAQAHWGKVDMVLRTVFYVSEQAISEGVPKAFKGTPFIINEDGCSEDLINEYIFARRNGDWAGSEKIAGLEAEVSGADVLRAALNYLRSRAYHLDAFRRWCRRNGVVITRVSQKKLELYADDLEEGIVTDYQGGILPQSANQHLISIIDFLTYCVAMGWRAKLGLSRRRRRARQRHRAGRPMGKGPVENPFTLLRRTAPSQIEVWYAEDEIESFVAELETSSAKLAARIMHSMGLRISEVLLLTTKRFQQSPSIARTRHGVTSL